MGAHVVLSDWKPGLRKVSLNKLLRERAGLSLSEAHEAVNQLLAGEQVKIAAPTEAAASAFVSEAEELGALATVIVAT